MAVLVQFDNVMVPLSFIAYISAEVCIDLQQHPIIGWSKSRLSSYISLICANTKVLTHVSVFSTFGATDKNR
jgi:hypothetical protein